MCVWLRTAWRQTSLDPVNKSQPPPPRGVTEWGAETDMEGDGLAAKP